MQQLKAVLISLSGNILSTVESELRDYGGVVDAQFPDILAALTSFRIAPVDKRLFVLELHGSEDVARLARLTEGFPDQPVLALIHRLDSESLLNAVRVGAAQFVSLPFKPGELREALDRTARQFGLRVNVGRVIAVCGATEGCGSTTIALNLASEAKQLGVEQSLLLELGSRIGRLAVILAIRPQYTTDDLLANIDSIDLAGMRKSITPVRQGFSLLPGGYQTFSTSKPPLSAVLRLLAMARRLVDVVVLDMAYSYDEIYFGVLKEADDVILIAEQKIPSLHSLLLLRDTLAKQGGHARLFYVINRYSEHHAGATMAEITHLMPAVHFYPVHSDGRGVMESINLGKLLREAAPNSPVLADLDKLMEAIAGAQFAPTPPAAPQSGWIRRSIDSLFGNARKTDQEMKPAERT